MQYENKNKAIILTIVAVSFLLIVVFGAAYAYFQVLSSSNVTGTNTQGQTDTMPKGTLVTNRDAILLKINLDANLMKKENENTTYYATPSGVPVTVATEGSGKYVLATASLDKEGLVYDCTYSYRVSTTKPPKEIKDGSDADVKVTITGSDGTSKTYTLAQLIKKEEIYTGNIKGLTYGENQKIYIEAYVENTNKAQDDLAGNSYTFKIELVNNSFKCDLPKLGEVLATKLIDSKKLWQSGLEGDGYRYIGSGNYNSTTTPNNFICFGTSDKTECKNNEAKYMYRIIGVFPDNSSNQHVKLISFKQLISATWNSNNNNIDWGSSTLFTSLNGSGFLTNSTYDYLQNSTWLNKIENWIWSAVNTKTYSDSGPNYNNVTTQAMYLHEMNRSGKSSSVGEWSTPTAKIGLMYSSDYQMSLGSSSLSYTGMSNKTTLKTGWMHQSNNDITSSSSEWTLSRYGYYGGYVGAWIVTSDGQVSSNGVGSTYGIRPVFHLTSDIRIIDGDGSYSNPYIL